MRISFSAAYKQVVSPPGVLNTEPFMARPHSKDKVVVGGATGTGKSRLSIDLAIRFGAEIINSDKIQVTDEERRRVPHHLLGVVDPNWEFTATDFGRHASLAVGRLPITAGGSNSYIKNLVSDNIDFQSKYDCFFLWVYASLPLPVLNSFVYERVDSMVEIGLVDKIGGIFYTNADHMRAVRRAIGAPKALMLKEAIQKIKSNTYYSSCYRNSELIRSLATDIWRALPLEAILEIRAGT